MAVVEQSPGARRYCLDTAAAEAVCLSAGGQDGAEKLRDWWETRGERGKQEEDSKSQDGACWPDTPGGRDAWGWWLSVASPCKTAVALCESHLTVLDHPEAYSVLPPPHKTAGSVNGVEHPMHAFRPPSDPPRSMSSRTSSVERFSPVTSLTRAVILCSMLAPDSSLQRCGVSRRFPGGSTAPSGIQ